MLSVGVWCKTEVLAYISVSQMVVRGPLCKAEPRGPRDYLIVLFSSSENHVKWNKKQRKNRALHILNILQNMFICLESILLIAVRGFISIFVCGTTFHKWELRNDWS
jgi:hypothetical protein